MPNCAVCKEDLTGLKSYNCETCGKDYCQDHFDGHNCEVGEKQADTESEQSQSNETSSSAGKSVVKFIGVSLPSLFLFVWSLDALLLVAKDVFLISIVQLLFIGAYVAAEF